MQENPGPVRVSPKEGHENDQKAGTSLCKNDERVGVKPGEEKALEDLISAF